MAEIGKYVRIYGIWNFKKFNLGLFEAVSHCNFTYQFTVIVVVTLRNPLHPIGQTRNKTSKIGDANYGSHEVGLRYRIISLNKYN